MENLIELAVAELAAKYNPHTAILYGSYARGEATSASDIDIACFCDDSPAFKDARLFHGVYLDAWIYPSSALEDVPPESLRYADGRVVIDRAGLGGGYLSRVRETLARGPEPLADDELRHKFEWVGKMLARAGADSLDAHFRRAWLQVDLLQLYFEFRSLWYLGHKQSFAYLAEHDPDGLQLFTSMYEVPDDHAAMRAVARHVTSVVAGLGTAGADG